MNASRPDREAHLRHLEIAALGLILALAAYLRLANVAHNPGWYTDEGSHLDIAQNLLRGRVQYLAINQSTLMFAKLPLFELLLAGLLGTIGGGLATLRTLTGVLGVVSVGLLYGIVRRMQRDPVLPLLSALMLAIYPQAVVYNRFGFSYNLLTPLVLLATLGCWEYLASTHRRWLALAALVIGLGGVSDLWMFVLAAPLVLVVLRRNWRDLLWSLPLALLPFGLYAAVMLICEPRAFLFDLNFVLFRLNKLSLAGQAKMLAVNYATLIFQDAWIALGLVGLFLLRPLRLRRLSLLLFLLPIFILGRTTALYSLGFYYTIPLMPFVGLGTAALLRYGVPYVWQTLHIRRLSKFWRTQAVAAIGVLLIVVTPLASSLASTVAQVREGFTTPIDPFLLDPAHARSIAESVNHHASPDDVVVASPTLTWLIDANVADVQMATVAAGYLAPDLPSDIPADRFAFDPNYRQARFVIVDNLWYNWAVWNVPGTPAVLREIQEWSLAFEGGKIEVYENPNR